MSERRDEDYVESKSIPTTPKSSSQNPIFGLAGPADGAIGQPPVVMPVEPVSDDVSYAVPILATVQVEASSDSGSERSSKVGNLILQAAHQARQNEQAQATARAAAQISAQAKKMKGRARRIMPSSDVPEAEPYFEMNGGESKSKELDESKAIPTAKYVSNYGYGGMEGKGYNLPMPPAFALLDIGKSNKRFSLKNSLFNGSLGSRICTWSTIFLLIITLLVGVSLLTIYFTLTPRRPEYGLSEVRAQWWSTYKDERGELHSASSEASSLYLSAVADFIIEARNPNSNLIVHYPNTTLEVSYQGVYLGSSMAPAAVLFPGDLQHITVPWKCNLCPLTGVERYLLVDQQSGLVPVSVKFKVGVSFEVNGIESPPYFYETEYHVTVTIPKV